MPHTWVHNMCKVCWDEKHPDRLPIVLLEKYRSSETCCWCGSINKDGIFVRENPNFLPCGQEKIQ